MLNEEEHKGETDYGWLWIPVIWVAVALLLLSMKSCGCFDPSGNGATWPGG